MSTYIPASINCRNDKQGSKLSAVKLIDPVRIAELEQSFVPSRPDQ